MMSLRGTIHKIFDEQQIKETFRKREFVVKYAENPQYPELIKFEATQDRCSILDEYEPGDEVDVKFNIKGREWVNRNGETVYFTTLAVWEIARAGAAPAPSSGGRKGGSSAGSSSPTEPAAPFTTAADPLSDDDLPF